jgi:hypothetical protein
LEEAIVADDDAHRARQDRRGVEEDVEAGEGGGGGLFGHDANVADGVAFN